MPERIVMTIHDLGIGGAERVFAKLANHWSVIGHEVTAITLGKANTNRVGLQSSIRRIGLDLMGESRSLLDALRQNRRRVRALREALRQSDPSTIVSFTDKMNILTLLAARGLRGRVIIAERSDPEHQHLGKAWESLRRWTYPRCDALVVQTETVKDRLRPAVRGKPIFVIPNSVAATFAQRPAAGQQDDAAMKTVGKTILGVGRLSREKGFDLLVEAFARVASDLPDWSLRLVGDGVCRNELARQAERMMIAERVEFAGTVDEPAAEYAAADLFVLPSRYEGFPNSLLEAMGSGLPVIASDCDSGPREIIRDGLDGILVPAENIDALAAAITRLARDRELRLRLGAGATTVVDRFSDERFFRAWDEVLLTKSCR